MEAEKNFDSVKDVVVTGKVVGVRVDFNVPILNGVVQDVSRIRAAAETVQFLRQNGAKILLLSHLGRPKGLYDESLSNRQLIKVCSAILGTEVGFVGEISERSMAEAVDAMKSEDIVLLENVRFNKGEMENSPEFAAIMAAHMNVYVNDAFSCSHRSHASIEAITHKVTRSVAGFSLMKEVQSLRAAFQKGVGPKIAVLGGSKVSTKMGLLSHLLEHCEAICLGGGIANALLRQEGFNIGRSLYEEGTESIVGRLYGDSGKLDSKIVLPADVVVINNTGEIKTRRISEVEDEDRIMDIGTLSTKSIEGKIAESRTVMMNGPLGFYEQEPFQLATENVIKFVADSTRRGQLATSIAGGGDLVSCINKCNAKNGFTFVSNAGGAFLEFISGIELPGIKALQEAKERFDSQER